MSELRQGESYRATVTLTSNQTGEYQEIRIDGEWAVQIYIDRDLYTPEFGDPDFDYGKVLQKTLGDTREIVFRFTNTINQAGAALARQRERQGVYVDGSTR